MIKKYRFISLLIAAGVLAVSAGPTRMANAAEPENPVYTSRLTYPYGAPVSMEIAHKVTAAAIAEGKKNGWTVAVAVVDAGGTLAYFDRVDGTQNASSDLAIQKARTALNYRRSTKLLEDRIVAGQLKYLSQTAALPIDGGFPLVEDGRIVGAIAVSGARAEQDGICAKAGVEALSQSAVKSK